MDKSVTLIKKNLFFDIDAAMYLAGERLQNDGNIKVAELIKSDTSDDMDNRLVTRYADGAVARLKGELSRWIEDTTAGDADDELDDGDYDIDFVFSDEFVPALLQPMTVLMHEYVVMSASREWLAKFGVQGAGPDELADIVRRVKGMALHRRMPEITHD